MILQFIRTGSIDIPMILALVVILLVGMTLHEYAHCLMATWWGDPTPREKGHLTLNPMVHIYWPGFLMFLFLGFGILGLAPVNPRRMRDPRWGAFWTAFAGPLMNLLLAVVSALILHFISGPLIDSIVTRPSETTINLIQFVLSTLWLSISINVLMFVFNLLPFFPLDGWRMVLAVLPGRFLDRTQVPDTIRKNVRPLSAFLQAPAFKWADWAQASQFVLMAMVVISLVGRNFGLSFDPLSLLISRPASIITSALSGN